ncbi:MAG: segregation and condensation protein A [Planctomycetota bacterium]
MSDADELDYGYKVELEDFSGPLDLLLYLIRQEEVDITNIPVARITDQYLAHLEVLQAVNVNLAGEFLVMAATLMEIKSRMLLPAPEAEEEDEEDPRADLIRQLMEYKKFKDAARRLGSRGEEQALKFVRGSAAAVALPEREPEDDLPILIGELTVWDLVAAFKVVLQQTSVAQASEIALDDKPLTAYCNDLLARLQGRATVAFRDLFDRQAGRMAVISTFLALLELMKRRRVRAEQGDREGEIRIVILDESPVTPAELIEQPASPEPPADAEAPAEGQPAATDAGPPSEGPAAAKPRRPRRSRRPADLPMLDDADDEFGLEDIAVPPVRHEPDAAPRGKEQRSRGAALHLFRLRRRPRPTALALLARRRPRRRRPRPPAILRR